MMEDKIPTSSALRRNVKNFPEIPIRLRRLRRIFNIPTSSALRNINKSFELLPFIRAPLSRNKKSYDLIPVALRIF